MEFPCVVFVIDDNSYGLIVVLRFSLRSCPYAMLEPYVGLKMQDEEDRVHMKKTDEDGVEEG
jgi:hypothetical protein